MSDADVIRAQFAALSHASDVWEAQAHSAYAQRDADRWRYRAEQLRAREYQPPRVEPVQQPLRGVVRVASTTRVCPRCHGAVLPRADSGPVPDYCSGRCQAATSDRGHEAHRRHKPVRRRGEERAAAFERAVRADPRQGALAFA